MKSSTKLRFFIESALFSILLIQISAGVRIINPKNVGWLSVGDGTMEIAWEFFRKQPLFQFPIGLNSKYGLEISPGLAYDGNLPLLSLLLHPFSEFLPARFQYVGIFLLLTFGLNYYFAKKIFIYLDFKDFSAIASSLILSTSPVILNRYIENTHYALTSFFIIFYGILLVLRKDLDIKKWLFLYLISASIFMYFIVFIFIMHLFLNFEKSLRDRKITNKEYIKFILSLSVILALMYIIGFFNGDVSSGDVGYGTFRSTLSSLFDSSGWSMLLPDIPELYGTYEGFSFIGTTSIILLLFNLVIHILSKYGKSNNMNPSKIKFGILFYSALILFFFSLSNKVAFAKTEILTFGIPSILEPLANTFRSTGRFTWLLAIVIPIFLLFKLSRITSVRTFNIIISVSLAIGFFDALPQLVSQNDRKFNTIYTNSLSSESWKEIHSCYQKIRVYPPISGVYHYYDLVNLANSQNLGINTGRFGRTSSDKIIQAYTKMHNDFIYGTFENDSFYIFSASPFISSEVIDFQKNIALKSLNDETGWGLLNGFTFIAPNISKCASAPKLKSKLKSIGVLYENKYNGEELFFGIGRNSNNYILSGFSALENWGVWSANQGASLILHKLEKFKPIRLEIQGKSLISNNNVQISINDDSIGTCVFQLSASTCKLDVSGIRKSNILNIKILAEDSISPAEVGISQDKNIYGIGLLSVKLSDD